MYRRITLTTDFSVESQTAFFHALALAVQFRAKLDILHVRARDETADWPLFPKVRETLSGWGLLEAGALSAAVFEQLGVAINKVDVPADDAVKAMSRFVRDHNTELLVAASHGRTGLNLWLSGSVAADLALSARVPALLLGPRAKPFISSETGKNRLARVLFPLAVKPSPHGALDELVQFLGGATADVSLLHVREGQSRFDSGHYEGLPVVLRDGDAVKVIIDEAQAQATDLLVMATEGRHGLLDALRGSTTARVLHDAPCPLLAVPVVPD